MQTEEEKFPEPPELRKKGIPPLKKELKFIIIAFVVAFIIVLTFSLIFKAKNG